MSELRAILIRETELARLFRIADQELWVPKSVTKDVVKFKPDAQGERECLVEIADWWCEKNGI
jgi:hypothetical protein